MTGLRWRELDAGALAAREPDLDKRYTFGVLAEDGAHCTDPAAYIAAIVAAAHGHGAKVVRATAREILRDGARVRGVRTDAGVIACDRVVIAAGAWSKHLARAAGDRIPLESERGYHGVIALDAGGPRHPVMPSDGKMANTPTSAGLRLSGQVELASLDAPPNWSRLDILMAHARRTYPVLAGMPEMPVDRWMGHRPSTPDGLPVIGRSSRSPDIFYAFGHGHVGFAAGPATGRIVAQHVAGLPDAPDLAVFSPRRFRLFA
jgi:D-amino-acid dehydrogenase